MRYQEDHKEKTHKKIVERASQEFREHGFEGIGIATLMSKLGLSHGGFYAHFEDKEDLKDQAMEHAFERSIETAAETLLKGGVMGYVEHYTSELHRDHPGFGCILPALTAEEGRRSPQSKAKFAQKYRQGIDVLAGYLPGATLSQKRERAIYIFSALSGSVALARASGDPDLSSAILRATREQLRQFLSTL
ncbi:TetR/AcrR family transcriptional regulator [Fimbriimonas ginsengisoli]|uniref:TetR family transcriptional regulator n=1 Tax=Fimbriimonas ginsengisoli Gsoil 348 TaxID=661478 RepID=A0A068NSF3_FIMGI|nr:TetR/AcrR family transcriptional regulator [Fimbriimonas ginsengisoli]AIE85690.1 TetR family transcriptional regulator [Fimbriimonas ginsengisoli Gsoil 348]